MFLIIACYSPNSSFSFSVSTGGILSSAGFTSVVSDFTSTGLVSTLVGGGLYLGGGVLVLGGIGLDFSQFQTALHIGEQAAVGFRLHETHVAAERRHNIDRAMVVAGQLVEALRVVDRRRLISFSRDRISWSQTFCIIGTTTPSKR